MNFSIDTTGNSRPIDDFPVLNAYLKSTDGEYPRVINPAGYYNYKKVLEEIKELPGAKTIFIKSNYEPDKNEVLNIREVLEISRGYFLDIGAGFRSIQDFDLSEEDVERYGLEDDFLLLGFPILMTPLSESSLYQESLEKSILDIFRNSILDFSNSSPSIGMIYQEEGAFYMKDFKVVTFPIIEGDLHYGKGFDEFHQKLMERFQNETKGLVLLHGEPGTGKTYYIRSLLEDLRKIDKFVIYLPPNMIEYLISPEMINFISELIVDKALDGKSCVILLEDAEPLIESRSVSGRSNGITNLLNMTDGLLNDVLNLQVIATFNTEISNIDDALLREERLIARKEFKKLTLDDTNKLLKFLKLDSEEKGMTLAEIYSIQKENGILIHEYSSERRKIGF